VPVGLSAVALEMMLNLLLGLVALSQAPVAVQGAASASEPTTDSPLLTPSLVWVNTPVLPNETALVQGAYFGHMPHVTISQVGVGSPVVVTPLQVTNNSIMCVIPASFTPGAFDIEVSSVDPVSLARSAAASIIANAPEIWWAQGDPGGSKALAGGSIRVFGRGLSIEADSIAHREGRGLDIEFAALAEQLQRAARQGNTVELARITEKQQRLLTQREIVSVEHVTAGAETTLLLEPHGIADSTAASPITLVANKANLSAVAASFDLPSNTTPGVYTVCLSNGPARSCLDSFYSAAQPRQQTLEIVAASTVAWPTQRFEVDDVCKESVSNTSKQLNCTDAILDTIAKAGAAGGGVVVFGLGRYYVSGPLLLPDNVRLQGAGMGMTALYFQFSSLLDVPQSFVANADDAKRYGVSDLDIYILSFYVNVFSVGVNTDGVEIHRVRVRANSMFCQNMCENGRIPPWSDQACGQDMDYYGKRGFSDCPKCAWPWREQPVFALFGNNWQVTECDIFSTYNAFYSGVTSHVNGSDMSTWQNYSNFQSAQFGLVRGNKVLHGGNCHWWDGNKQLIYEQNSCTGASPMAGGSNIATYEGGDAHHLYLGGNSWAHTYGNDREVMTYDDAGTVYTGPLLGVSANGRNLTLRGGNFSAPAGSHNMRTGAKMNAQLNHGKVVVITNGTGAGQYRRVVDWSWDVSEAGHSHWVLDRPFDLLSPDSQIEVSTFRGNNIFHNNHYEDCGVFQFYGVGINNLVMGMTTKRQDGIVANGQRADFFDWSIDKQYHSGTQPNLYNQFIGESRDRPMTSLSIHPSIHPSIYTFVTHSVCLYRR
jgi:hypothetical protein